MNILELYNQHNNFGKWLDMTYEVIKPGQIEYHLTVKENLLATPNAAHGGAISAFMDAVVGVAALSAVYEEGKVVSTVEFKINYIKAALIGDQLKGIGQVIRKGKSLIIVRGDIYNQKDELIATSLATMNAYPIEKSAF